MVTNISMVNNNCLKVVFPSYLLRHEFLAQLFPIGFMTVTSVIRQSSLHLPLVIPLKLGFKMHQFLAKLWLEPSPAPPHLITFRKLNYSLFRLLIDSSKSLSLYLSVSLSLCHSLSLSLYLFGSLSLCLHQILPINLRLSHLCNICRSA